jgi:REP element-mobilizing transposase RayT
MILGYHLIISNYGFWLPNDPRGSNSDFVRSPDLLRYGKATKVTTRRSVAGKPHDAALRRAAKSALKHSPVSFTGIQARAVGRGIADYVGRSGVTVWACSILPEHTHLVIARHTYSIEQMANLLKGAATTQLLAEGLHPFARQGGRVPTCWARRERKVFLDSPKAILRSIKYVEDNPLKEGKPRQHWAFVTPYRG